MPVNNTIIADIAEYYSNKLQEHGSSHWGVDWNSTESQELRFHQLCKVIELKEEYTLLDYGTGYGALFPFLQKKYPKLNSFIGFDISKEMIDKAKELFKESGKSYWYDKLQEDLKVDYVLASGLFNVRLDNPSDKWLSYILSTIDILNKHATKGFSFNILTSYSDEEYKKEYLYYADPLFFFDYCKKKISKNVALLHDYDLYEFTIIVKK